MKHFSIFKKNTNIIYENRDVGICLKYANDNSIYNNDIHDNHGFAMYIDIRSEGKHSQALVLVLVISQENFKRICTKYKVLNSIYNLHWWFENVI
ncbi:MAG: right-handed parallel beta-helix repeat-containing protein [Candidatus Odinarchaeota archaeon]|nr:right-handed parallel beta-helix repeat-containing protein [Candidatus Odinarchaeota archaeon]